MNYHHQPVLVEEVLAQLNPQVNQNFIDGTVGGGGHAAAILAKTGPAGRLIGLDRDPAAVAAAQKNLAAFSERAIIVQGNYSNIDQAIEKIKNKYETGRHLRVSGILLDLGLSSAQVSLEDERGFSFQGRQPLDMRFGPQAALTAAEILNTWSEEELIKIFKEYGEERHARLIAQKIVAYRRQLPINFTDQLVEVIKQVYKGRYNRISARGGSAFGRNPATKIFQALRIAVNDELNNLQLALPRLLSILPAGGRLAIISFHSLEDRIVKNFFQTEAKDCLCPPQLPVCRCGHKKSVKILTKKPLTASAEEIKNNPKSRSARMRAAEKL